MNDVDFFVNSTAKFCIVEKFVLFLLKFPLFSFQKSFFKLDVFDFLRMVEKILFVHARVEVNGEASFSSTNS